MSPEEIFKNSHEAGDFLVEMAHSTAKFVSGKRKYRGGHPQFYPNTWLVMMGAKMVGSATEKLDKVDVLSLIPELIVISLYLDVLTETCRDGESFLLNNLGWAQEVDHDGLNQPHGRIMMYAEILDSKNKINSRLQLIRCGE